MTRLVGRTSTMVEHADFTTGMLMKTLAMGLLTAGLAALAFTGPASGQGMEFDPVGSPGGSFFRASCPAGAFMVGLKGRAGDVIDNMHVFCAFVRPLPANSPRKNWTRDQNSTGTFQVGNFIGLSGGGSPDDQLCGPPHLVKTIRFNTLFLTDCI